MRQNSGVGSGSIFLILVFLAIFSWDIMSHIWGRTTVSLDLDPFYSIDPNPKTDPMSWAWIQHQLNNQRPKSGSRSKPRSEAYMSIFRLTVSWAYKWGSLNGKWFKLCRKAWIRSNALFTFCTYLAPIRIFQSLHALHDWHASMGAL